MPDVLYQNFFVSKMVNVTFRLGQKCPCAKLCAYHTHRHSHTHNLPKVKPERNTWLDLFYRLIERIAKNNLAFWQGYAVQ